MPTDPSAPPLPTLEERLDQFLHEMYDAWDNDNDSRLGKLILSLAGQRPGYRADHDAFRAELAQSGALRVREEEGQGEQQKDLGGHVPHGGRSDHEPAAPPELPHDAQKAIDRVFRIAAMNAQMPEKAIRVHEWMREFGVIARLLNGLVSAQASQETHEDIQDAKFDAQSY